MTASLISPGIYPSGTVVAAQPGFGPLSSLIIPNDGTTVTLFSGGLGSSSINISQNVSCLASVSSSGIPSWDDIAASLIVVPPNGFFAGEVQLMIDVD